MGKWGFPQELVSESLNSWGRRWGEQRFRAQGLESDLGGTFGSTSY